MCVYVYIYIHTYLHACMHRYTRSAYMPHICFQEYVNIYIHTKTPKSCIHTNTTIHSQVHFFMADAIYKYMHVYIHTYINDTHLQGNFFLADTIGLKLSIDSHHREPADSILIEQTSAQYRKYIRMYICLYTHTHA